MPFGFNLKLPKVKGGAGVCTVEELNDIVTQLMSIERAINELVDVNNPKAREIPGPEALQALNKLVKEYETTLQRLYDCTGSLEGYDQRLQRVKSKLPV